MFLFQLCLLLSVLFQLVILLLLLLLPVVVGGEVCLEAFTKSLYGRHQLLRLKILHRVLRNASCRRYSMLDRQLVHRTHSEISCHTISLDKMQLTFCSDRMCYVLRSSSKITNNSVTCRYRQVNNLNNKVSKYCR